MTHMETYMKEECVSMQWVPVKIWQGLCVCSPRKGYMCLLIVWNCICVYRSVCEGVCLEEWRVICVCA